MSIKRARTFKINSFQAAKLLGVSRKTIRRMCERGDIKGKSIRKKGQYRGNWEIDFNSCIKWLKKN